MPDREPPTCWFARCSEARRAAHAPWSSAARATTVAMVWSSPGTSQCVMLARLSFLPRTCERLHRTSRQTLRRGEVLAERPQSWPREQRRRWSKRWRRRTSLWTRSFAQGWTRRGWPGAQKAPAGNVLVVAGSRGRVGARQRVARGALRAGAGLATIATWPAAADAIESHALEVMTARIDSGDAARSLDGILRGKNAIAIGPGLGLNDDARTGVEYILA